MKKWGMLACVASVSVRVIARKLERKRKKKKRCLGEGRRGNACPQTPLFWPPPPPPPLPWYFTVRFVCKLTARQNRSIPNRLPLDCQTCKITVFSNKTRPRRLQKMWWKKVYNKRRLKLWAIAAKFLAFLLCGFISSWNLVETSRGGGRLGIFWVGMCRPGLQIGTLF